MDGLTRVRTALARLMLVEDPNDLVLIRAKIEVIGDPKYEFERRIVEAYQALIATWSPPKEGL
jgi:hypothetical protein